MMSAIASRNTDHLRRAALQIAMQLPENVGEARRVLHLADGLLEDFLITAPREVCSPPLQPAIERAPAARPLFLAVLTVLAVAVLTPLAALASWCTGAEPASGWVLAVGLFVVALTFGRSYGTLFSVLAVLSYHLAMAPAWALPSVLELVRLAGYCATALLLPQLATSACKLRRLILSAGAGRALATWSPGRPASLT